MAGAGRDILSLDRTVDGASGRINSALARMANNAARSLSGMGTAVGSLRRLVAGGMGGVAALLTSPFSGAAASVGRIMAGLASSVGSSVRGITGALGSIGLAADGLRAIGSAATGMIKGLVSGNAQFEDYNVQFGVLLGGADKAQARLKELAEFGARTPFELPQLVEADRVLTAFGLSAEDTQRRFGRSGQEIRTIIGDVASGTGADFKELAGTFGRFASGATGEAIARFQELGITTRERMAQLGLQFSKSGELLTPARDAFAVIMGDMQKRFGGMMEAQSRTFNGMVSNLQDWVGATKRTLGAPIFEVIRPQLQNVLTFLNNLTASGAIDRFAARIAQGLAAAGRAVVPFISVLRRVPAAIAEVRSASNVFDTGWVDAIAEGTRAWRPLVFVVGAAEGAFNRARLGVMNFAAGFRAGFRLTPEVQRVVDFLQGLPARAAAALRSSSQVLQTFGARVSAALRGPATTARSLGQSLGAAASVAADFSVRAGGAIARFAQRAYTAFRSLPAPIQLMLASLAGLPAVITVAALNFDRLRAGAITAEAAFNRVRRGVANFSAGFRAGFQLTPEAQRVGNFIQGLPARAAAVLRSGQALQGFGARVSQALGAPAITARSLGQNLGAAASAAINFSVRAGTAITEFTQRAYRAFRSLPTPIQLMLAPLAGLPGVITVAALNFDRLRVGAVTAVRAVRNTLSQLPTAFAAVRYAWENNQPFAQEGIAMLSRRLGTVTSVLASMAAGAGTASRAIRSQLGVVSSVLRGITAQAGAAARAIRTQLSAAAVAHLPALQNQLQTFQVRAQESLAAATQGAAQAPGLFQRMALSARTWITGTLVPALTNLGLRARELFNTHILPVVRGIGSFIGAMVRASLPALNDFREGFRRMMPIFSPIGAFLKGVFIGAMQAIIPVLRIGALVLGVVFVGSLQAAGKAFKELGTFLGWVGRLLQPFNSTIQRIGQVVGYVFASVFINSLTGGGAAFARFAVLLGRLPLLGAHFTRFAAVVASRMSVLLPWWQRFQTVLRVTYDAGMRTIGAFSRLILGFVRGAGTNLSALVRSFTGAWDSIIRITTAFASRVSGSITGFGRTVMSTVQGFLNRFSGLWSGSTNNILNILRTGYARVTGFIMRPIRSAIDQVGGLNAVLFRAASYTISGFIDGITSRAKEIVNTIKTTVTDAIPNFIKDRLGIRSPSTLMAGFGGELIQGFINGVANSGQALLATLTNIVTNPVPELIRTAFGLAAGASTLFNTFGVDMIQGFINGIASMGGAVLDTIKNTVTSVVPDFIVNAFQQRSPSRLFFGLGRDTLEGYVQGIQAQAPRVEQAMSAVTGAATRAVQNVVSTAQRSSGGVILTEQERAAQQFVRADEEMRRKWTDSSKKLSELVGRDEAQRLNANYEASLEALRRAGLSNRDFFYDFGRNNPEYRRLVELANQANTKTRAVLKPNQPVLFGGLTYRQIEEQVNRVMRIRDNAEQSRAIDRVAGGAFAGVARSINRDAIDESDQVLAAIRRRMQQAQRAAAGSSTTRDAGQVTRALQTQAAAARQVRDARVREREVVTGLQRTYGEFHRSTQAGQLRHLTTQQQVNNLGTRFTGIARTLRLDAVDEAYQVVPALKAVLAIRDANTVAEREAALAAAQRDGVLRRVIQSEGGLAGTISTLTQQLGGTTVGYTQAQRAALQYTAVQTAQRSLYSRYTTEQIQGDEFLRRQRDKLVTANESLTPTMLRLGLATREGSQQWQVNSSRINQVLQSIGPQTRAVQRQTGALTANVRTTRAQAAATQDTAVAAQNSARASSGLAGNVTTLTRQLGGTAVGYTQAQRAALQYTTVQAAQRSLYGRYTAEQIQGDQSLRQQRDRLVAANETLTPTMLRLGLATREGSRQWQVNSGQINQALGSISGATTGTRNLQAATGGLVRELGGETRALTQQQQAAVRHLDARTRVQAFHQRYTGEQIRGNESLRRTSAGLERTYNSTVDALHSVGLASRNAVGGIIVNRRQVEGLARSVGAHAGVTRTAAAETRGLGQASAAIAQSSGGVARGLQTQTVAVRQVRDARVQEQAVIRQLAVNYSDYQKRVNAGQERQRTIQQQLNSLGTRHVAIARALRLDAIDEAYQVVPRLREVIRIRDAANQKEREAALSAAARSGALRGLIQTEGGLAGAIETVTRHLGGRIQRLTEEQRVALNYQAVKHAERTFYKTYSQEQIQTDPIVQRVRDKLVVANERLTPAMLQLGLATREGSAQWQVNNDRINRVLGSISGATTGTRSLQTATGGLGIAARDSSQQWQVNGDRISRSLGVISGAARETRNLGTATDGLGLVTKESALQWQVNNDRVSRVSGAISGAARETRNLETVTGGLTRQVGGGTLALQAQTAAVSQVRDARLREQTTIQQVQSTYADYSQRVAAGQERQKTTQQQLNDLGSRYVGIARTLRVDAIDEAYQVVPALKSVLAIRDANTAAERRAAIAAADRDGVLRRIIQTEGGVAGAVSTLTQQLGGNALRYTEAQRVALQYTAIQTSQRTLYNKYTAEQIAGDEFLRQRRDKLVIANETLTSAMLSLGLATREGSDRWQVNTTRINQLLQSMGPQTLAVERQTGVVTTNTRAALSQATATQNVAAAAQNSARVIGTETSAVSARQRAAQNFLTAQQAVRNFYNTHTSEQIKGNDAVRTTSARLETAYNTNLDALKRLGLVEQTRYGGIGASQTRIENLARATDGHTGATNRATLGTQGLNRATAGAVRPMTDATRAINVPLRTAVNNYTKDVGAANTGTGTFKRDVVANFQATNRGVEPQTRAIHDATISRFTDLQKQSISQMTTMQRLATQTANTLRSALDRTFRDTETESKNTFNRINKAVQTSVAGAKTVATANASGLQKTVAGSWSTLQTDTSTRWARIKQLVIGASGGLAEGTSSNVAAANNSVNSFTNNFRGAANYLSQGLGAGLALPSVYNPSPIRRGGITMMAKGTRYWKGGEVIAGETGKEAILTPGARHPLLVNGPTFLNLPRGTQIFNPDETRRLLESRRNLRPVREKPLPRARPTTDAYSGPGGGLVHPHVPRQYWPNGVVPYTVSGTSASRVAAAAAMWNNTAGVRIRPRQNERQYLRIYGGSANVSRFSGGHPSVELTSGAPVHIATHELGHSLGLAHEQKRADAARYVRVLPQNMSEGHLSQFTPDRTLRMVGPFDWNSIMIYGSYYFSRNGLPTLLKRNGDIINPGRQPSRGDIAAVRALYSGALNGPGIRGDYTGVPDNPAVALAEIRAAILAEMAKRQITGPVLAGALSAVKARVFQVQVANLARMIQRNAIGGVDPDSPVPFVPGTAQTIRRLDEVFAGSGLAGQGRLYAGLAKGGRVPLGLALAQAQQESSLNRYGESPLNKNPYNIRPASWQQNTTGTSRLNFAIFRTLADGIRAYFQLMNRPPYRGYINSGNWLAFTRTFYSPEGNPNLPSVQQYADVMVQRMNAYHRRLGTRGYASGGFLTEPVSGIGLRSGRRYSFAERGIEAVFNARQLRVLERQMQRGNGGGGPVIHANITVRVDGAGRSADEVRQAAYSGTREAMRNLENRVNAMGRRVD